MPFQLPGGFNVSQWVGRWDRMQERYNLGRDERFATVADVIQLSVVPRLIVDLGCGTGSLALRLLEAFGEARVVGIDLDPTMLALARERLKSFGRRAVLIEADLRKPDCLAQAVSGQDAGGLADAVVSATALHWLAASQLEGLYGRIAKVLRPGGVFLNADHVASPSPAVQRLWEERRREAVNRPEAAAADRWDGFWQAFAEATGTDLASIRKQALGDWAGVEEGMPLAWHFDKLLAAGFASADCFWRHGGDAAYGALL